jgi:hypothetical protein
VAVALQRASSQTIKIKPTIELKTSHPNASQVADIEGRLFISPVRKDRTSSRIAPTLIPITFVETG